MPARFCFVLVALAAGRSVNAEHYDAVGAARPRRRSRRSSSGIDAPKRASAGAALSAASSPAATASRWTREPKLLLMRHAKGCARSRSAASLRSTRCPCRHSSCTRQQPSSSGLHRNHRRSPPTSPSIAPTSGSGQSFESTRPCAAAHRVEGFVLEAGGLDGVIAGSNSYLFERFLGWNGLMVEANQLNFAKLLATRPESSAPKRHSVPAGNLSFTGPGGCCNSVAGKPAKHTGAGLRDGKWGDSHAEPRSSNEYKVRCTPIGPLPAPCASRPSTCSAWMLNPRSMPS